MPHGVPPILGGWDSPQHVIDAIERGESIGVMPPSAWGLDEYIEAASEPPTPWVSPAITSLSIGNTVLGTLMSPQPGVMLNTINAGVWSGFDPNDMAGSLAALHAFAISMYGSTELGTVRYSSEALENEPTGVRPGTMERIVIPAWARRERGSPL